MTQKMRSNRKERENIRKLRQEILGFSEGGSEIT